MKLTFALAASLLLSTAVNASEGPQQFKILVNNANHVDEIGPGTARGIFGGTVTMWDNVEDSGLTGEIQAFRLMESVPATQAFKTAVGLAQFGADVTVFSGNFAPRILAVIVANLPRAIAVNDPSQALFPGEHAVELDD